MSTSPRTSQRTWLICFALLAVTIVAYSPIFGAGFINYDDPEYVTGNKMVKLGLTWEGVKWAFTTNHAGNWHPLTWLSHMLDCQLFGLNPLAHHTTNLLLHLANTLLLFTLFKRMTGFVWRSALVAALFALHPMHVESVAWVSERKDVLSTFFGLVSTWFYLGFAGGRRKGLNYILALLFFTASLLSKGMLVTLPFVWLLLDWWPLDRFLSGTSASQPETKRVIGKKPIQAVLEKLPFFFLSTVISLVTYVVQDKAIMAKAGNAGSWLIRFTIIDSGYVRYLAKLLVPVKLAVLYPIAQTYRLTDLGAMLLLLILLCVIVIIQSRRRPWLFVGWFWFLGTLVPVIGFVKVGVQSIADRYTYIPAVGLFLIIVWGASECLTRFKWGRTLAFITVPVVLLLAMMATQRQISYWQSGKKLFEHSVAVTENNGAALDILGMVYLAEDKLDQASACFEKAVATRPDGITYGHMGAVSLRTGNIDAAISSYEKAAALEPDRASNYANLAEAMLKKGLIDESFKYISIALRLQPDSPLALYNLGTALLLKGQTNEAIANLEKALALDPDLPEAQNNLAYTLGSLGRVAEAEPHYITAIQLMPKSVDAHYGFANMLFKQKRFSEAEKHYRSVVSLDPELAEAYYQLGVICSNERRYADTAFYWREAMRRKSSWTDPLNNLSWLLSTCPDASIRDGHEALKLARSLETFTGDKNPDTLDTMATAFAELGQFDEAVEYEKNALVLLRAAKQETRLPAFQARLELFTAHKPYRE